MRNLIGFLFIIVVLSSCNKDNKYLKGRLMYDCDTPVTNTEIEMITVKGFNKIYEYATSDENGYFTIVYNEGSRGHLRINKSEILNQIPLQYPELELGDVHVGGTIDLIVKLQVNNPYTVNDTIRIFDLESNDLTEQISIPGPFTSGVVDTFIDGYFYHSPLTYGENHSLSYRHDFYPYCGNCSVFTDIDISFCDMNEITLVID